MRGKVRCCLLVVNVFQVLVNEFGERTKQHIWLPQLRLHRHRDFSHCARTDHLGLISIWNHSRISYQDACKLGHHKKSEAKVDMSDQSMNTKQNGVIRMQR